MAKQRHIPERTCLGCGQKRPKKELVRVVRMTEGGLSVDPSGKSPGRGAYLCLQATCWKKGTERGNLSRSLDLDVTAQDLERLFTEFQALAAATSTE